MNLQPLKVLVPSRVMLVVVLLIGLIAVWYYVSTTSQGAHLVRRNFNHLNQITANIDASVTAVREQVRFNQGMVCPPLAEEDNQGLSAKERAEKAKAACIEHVKKHLAANSPLVRDREAIRVHDHQVGRLKPLLSSPRQQVQMACTSKRIQRPECKAASATDIARAEQQNAVESWGALFDNKEAQCEIDQYVESLQSLKRKAAASSNFLVDGGISSDFQFEVALTRRAASMGSGSGEEATSNCSDHFLRLDISADLFFEQIQGLAQSEGYFDSIIIAQTGKGVELRERSSGKKGVAPEIIFNSASKEPYARVEKLQSIFRLSSGFERYRSISDLEQQHGVDRYRASLLPGEKVDKNPTEIPSQPFTHSTVVPFKVGGFEHLAFVQPLTLGNIEQDFLIIGVVEESKFNALKYRVPLNSLAQILVIFVLVLLSLNFIRLALIGKKGVLLKRDLHVSYVSLISMASLITILIGNFAASWQMQMLFDEDQQAIFDRVRSEFEFELMQKILLMKDRDLAEDYGASFCEDESDKLPINKRYKIFCKGAPVPDISALFTLNNSGEQVGEYRTHLISSPTPPFNVSRRDYFRAIQDGDAWLMDSSRLKRWWKDKPDIKEYEGLFDAVEAQRYFLHRIESYTDSTLETAISIPVKPAADDKTGATVKVAVSRFRSLEDIVMPAGFGLAVFDSRSGRVLYHDDPRRSLRENFYRATDDNADLKAAVIARVKTGVDLDYKGDDVHAVVGPLADTPWTLVVYYRESLVDIINFHFGVTASLLSAAFILSFLLGSGLLAITVPRLIQAWRGSEEAGVSIVPEWIYPLDGMSRRYIDLTAINLGLLLLYTGITYHLDINQSWPWLLAAPAVIYGLWHVRIRPEFYTGFPGPLGLLAPLVPYVFALWVVYHFVAKVWSNGGSGYLMWSALAALIVYGLLRGNEAFELWLLKNKSKEAKKAGQRARDLINYRRASCVFVLMLSVSPTILLYNENFDVHEKLWAEYTNWYNSGKLRDRSEGYQRYSRRTHNWTARQKTSEDLGKALLGTWQGVYLPRTEIYGLVGDAGASGGSREGHSHVAKIDPLMERWPPLRERYWIMPLEFDKEFTLYMLATLLSTHEVSGCHDHIKFDGSTVMGGKEPPETVDEQVAWLKYLVKALPSFSSTGLLLESFTERSREMHALPPIDGATTAIAGDDSCHGVGNSSASAADQQQGDAAGKEPSDKAPGGTTGRQPTLVAFDEFDGTSGLHYAMSSVFPHTRSAFPLIILAPYGFFLFISGLFVYLLTGFLADRQLGGRFARRKPFIDREAEITTIQKGGIMVVPAGVSLEAAYQQLLDKKVLVGDSFTQPDLPRAMGLRHVVVSDDMIVLKDFTGIIENRRLAARVMDFLEERLSHSAENSAAKQADGTAVKPSVVILSDIDPKYWLRARHLCDQMSTELFYRWESLVMSLQSYCLFMPGKKCPEPGPSCFRRIWERCSKDERLLLAGLRYEQVVNYRNLSAGISLYRRGILTFGDFQYRFINPAFARFVERQLPRDAFRAEAAGYENKLWLAFRGPILLALLATLAFIAYNAQDELRFVLSLMTTLGGTMMAVGALSDRIRDFRGYLGA